MIVIKAAQDKVLAALQSIAGIVERRHALPILANVICRAGNSSELLENTMPPVLLYAPLPMVVRHCERLEKAAYQPLQQGIERRRRYAGVSCWRLLGNGTPGS